MNYGAINIDPETMGGTPVFTGTRVPVQALFDYIESGETLKEFLDNFPSVKKDYAVQVLEMASKTITTEKILNENFA
ncbi:MAG: DUF433 domain-containing protein [Bacteroidota bacterium]|nr:DUF433 domain-containing protein [Bacteroidota bacterium]